MGTSPFSLLTPTFYSARLTNQGSICLQKCSPSRVATGVNTVKRAKGTPHSRKKLNYHKTVFIYAISLQVISKPTSTE